MLSHGVYVLRNWSLRAYPFVIFLLDFYSYKNINYNLLFCLR